MPSRKLNGSVEVLARAMRDVFTEAVQEGIGPVRKDVAGLKENIAEIKEDVAGVKRDIKTTNENMQAQFASQEKKIGKLLTGKIR